MAHTSLGQWAHGLRRQIAFRGSLRWPRSWAAKLGAAVTAYAGTFGLWVLFHWGGASHRALISDAAFLPTSLLAAALAWSVAARRQVDPRARRAWRLIAAAWACYWAGEMGWFYFDVVRHTAPFPSAADAGYLAFYPLLMWGLLSFPRPRRSQWESLTLGLDVATVVAASTLVVWFLVIGPTLATSSSGWLAQGLNVAYPVGDVVLLFAVAVVLMRRARGEWGLRLLAGGLLVFIVADVAYAHQSLSDAYTDGNWVDAAWMVAQLAAILSALAPAGAVSDDDLAPARARVSRLPYAAVGIAFGLLVLVAYQHADGPLAGLVLGAVAITALVVARQITALTENATLLARIQLLAQIDALTGLENRGHFFELAERSFARAARRGESLGAVMLDVDRFKEVNDGHGHGVGDAVLVEVARRCREVIRPTDIVGRYGGDELVMLLVGASLSRRSRRGWSSPSPPCP